MCCAAAAGAQTVPTGFRDELFTGGFDVPVAIEFLPDGRLLVAEQLSSRVRLVVNGVLSSTDPVLTVPNVVLGGEQGLLGVAIDPQFPARPYLYTHQTDAGGFVRISRWRLSGDLAFTGDGHLGADPASRYDLVANAPNQATNHNGGTVQFGPGGYLFVSLGEDATPCAAQDTSTLRGKILRLDVRNLPDGPGSAFRAQVAPAGNPFAASADSNAKLVYAHGLRNPFRFQLDAAAERLVIADVGQDLYEELDLLDASGSTGGIALDHRAFAGANFGWPWQEGASTYGSCPGAPPTSAPPIWVVDRSTQAAASIISAGAYRSSTPDTTRWPVEYHGDLFCNDYYSGALTRLTQQGDIGWGPAPVVDGQLDPAEWGTGYRYVTDWRVGSDGSLYYCKQFSSTFRNSGVIRRIVWTGGALPPPPPPPVPALQLTSRPAPAQREATISYDLASGTSPPLRIYDVRGRLLRTLEVPAGAGTHFDVRWDGADDAGRALPSGLYWARLESSGRQASCRIALLR